MTAARAGAGPVPTLLLAAARSSGRSLSVVLVDATEEQARSGSASAGAGSGSGACRATFVERYEGPEGRGLLFPDDGAFHPLRRTRELAARASGAGARLFCRTPVLSVQAGAVRTGAGPVRATRGVLVAVDGGLERLVPRLRGRLRSARLQMVGTAPATDVHLTRPVYARYGLDYWQQLPDGRVLLGGGRDVGGDAE